MNDNNQTQTIITAETAFEGETKFLNIQIGKKHNITISFWGKLGLRLPNEEFQIAGFVLRRTMKRTFPAFQKIHSSLKQG